MDFYEIRSVIGIQFSLRTLVLTKKGFQKRQEHINKNDLDQ